MRRRYKGSRLDIKNIFWALALFVCLILVITLGKEAAEVSSTYGNRELPIYSVETSDNRISISFDAAWGSEDFMDILFTLEKHQVKTTFFMTGEWVEANPEYVKLLLENGHDLGNHSMNHPDMTKLSKEKQREEIIHMHDLVLELTGYNMELFRPPYGAYNNEVIRTCYEMNYYPIQWDVDSLDWQDHSPEQIIANVCQHKNLGPGSIILCHNGAEHTADVLDEILTGLKAQGYEIVPISELILREDYHMDGTGRQKKDTN